jgi:cytochrome c553
MRCLLAAALVLWPACSVDADTLEQRLAACLACHGENGRSQTPNVPSLGAQPAFYVLIQLYMFREGLRRVDVMNEAAKGLSNDDLLTVAETIAQLPPPGPAAGAADRARVARAQAVIQQNRCNFCHKGDFTGEQNVPRLAGQREDYLVQAMRAYKDNTRRGYDAAMADVMYPIGDDQIRDLAHFLAHLP